MWKMEFRWEGRYKIISPPHTLCVWSTPFHFFGDEWTTSSSSISRPIEFTRRPILICTVVYISDYS
jgi:hypothetical protein